MSVSESTTTIIEMADSTLRLVRTGLAETHPIQAEEDVKLLTGCMFIVVQEVAAAAAAVATLTRTRAPPGLNVVCSRVGKLLTAKYRRYTLVETLPRNLQQSRMMKTLTHTHSCAEREKNVLAYVTCGCVQSTSCDDRDDGGGGHDS